MGEGTVTPREGWMAGAAGFLFLFVALVVPNDVAWISFETMLILPLGLPVLVLVATLVPPVLSPVLRGGATLLLALLLILKLADMAAYEALARPFDPILDLHLLSAAWNLVSGAVGVAAAAAIVVAIAASLALVVVLSSLAVGAVDRLASRRRLGFGATAGGVIVLAFLAPALYPQNRAADFASGYSADLMRRHATAFAASLQDLEAFERQARSDPAADVPSEVLFSRIGGRDVLLLFVESYGRTVLDNPLYAPSVRPMLERFDEVVEARGYHAASGFLTSPIAGGQSWLAHASALSGLWVDNQRRYNSLLVSERATLIDDFARAGWRTVAVMPAITMAWPEGEALGYDAIYDFESLGYRGLPFNWVTMPDQYTLSALDRLELRRDDRPPVFAEVALISSHAPWTPIPQVIDWEDVGDGAAFNEQAMSGDAPREVWSDGDRIRLQFRRSIEYALANLASYVGERMSDDAVMIILGDHQPARIITGETGNRDVPFHIISDDAGLIAAVGNAWGLSPGMLPDMTMEAERMSVLRGRFIAAFSDHGNGAHLSEEGGDDMSVGKPDIVLRE